MPTLMAKVFVDATNIPFVWECSGCKQVFSLDAPRVAEVFELHKIDRVFRVHCEQKHPGEPVVGLEIPPAKEDASQAAARIVREATGEK